MQDKSYDQLLEFDQRKLSLTIGGEPLIMRLVDMYFNAQVIILFHNSISNKSKNRMFGSKIV